MTTFTTEDRIIAEKDGSFTVNVEPIPFAGMVNLDEIKDILIPGFNFRFVKQGTNWVCTMPDWLLNEAIGVAGAVNNLVKHVPK